MAEPKQTAKGNGRLYVLFAIVVVGTALGGLTQTALNTMASTVLADLSTDIGWGQWLTTVYIFSMGAAVPLASFVQRKFSIRTLMLAAFGMYLVGSTCDFAAVNFPMLIIGRVLEAVASGILMPLLQTIAMTRFPENRHGTAMGIAGIALGFAPNIGPTIGGAIVVAAGWRFMFLVLMAASVVLIAATLAFVRERDVREPSATLDWVSLSLSTLGFGGMLLGFTAAANMPLTEPLVWLPVVLGAAAIAAFCRRQRNLERQGRLQLVNLRIFESQPYRASLATQLLMYGCFMGMTLIIPLFVVEAGGYTPFEAGLVLLPGALAALVFEPGAGIASDKFGPRRVAIFGGTCLAVGAISIAFVPADAPLWIPAICQAVRCVGLTSLIPTTTAHGLGSLGKAGLTTDGSAAMIMLRQISAALATAVMVCLVKAFETAPDAALGYHAALGFSGLLGLGALICAIAFIDRTHGGHE
ncbi:MAG: MFS transporter [Eggerthellaceae bacterium]|nr:MFS transporter [Eggerthellaceae bacterium]